MKRILKHKNLIGIGIFIIVFIIGASFIPYFLSINNLLNVVRQSAVIAICAVGVSMVIITKGIDLSTGGIISFCAMVSGLLMLNGINIIVSIICGMIMGALVGAVNGILVAKIGVQPFIATLVMGQVTTGIALLLNNGKSIGSLPDEYVFIGNGKFLGVPISVYLMIIFIAIGVYVMSRTRIGNWIYALGGNELVVKQEGLSTAKVLIFTYAFAGFYSSIGGLLLGAQLGTVHPTQGDTFTLDTIAACVIGGINLMGGEGKVIAAFFGAIIISILRNALNMLGMYPFYQNIFVGCILIIVVAISIISKTRRIDESKIF